MRACQAGEWVYQGGGASNEGACCCLQCSRGSKGGEERQKQQAGAADITVVLCFSSLLPCSLPPCSSPSVRRPLNGGRDGCGQGVELQPGAQHPHLHAGLCTGHVHRDGAGAGTAEEAGMMTHPDEQARNAGTLRSVRPSLQNVGRNWQTTLRSHPQYCCPDRTPSPTLLRTLMVLHIALLASLLGSADQQRTAPFAVLGAVMSCAPRVSGRNPLAVGPEH